MRPTFWTVFMLACACASAQTAPTPAADASPPPPPEPSRLQRANEVLDRALQSTALDQRTEALLALGISRRPDAKEKLSRALEDEKGEVRFAAAQGLYHLADPTVSPLLIRVWKSEKGWAVKKEIAYAAGACGTRALIPQLRHALKDVHREFQVAAALALKALGDPGAEARLARMKNPPSRGVLKEGADRWSRKVLAGENEGSRTLAARTLAEHGTREDLDLLEPLLKSEVATEQLWAAAAIIRFNK